MNEYILENAAIYVNGYRSSTHYSPASEPALRRHVIRLFGEVYAAILCK